MAKPPPRDIELAISPHAHRAGWHVLRVTYQDRPAHNARITAAIAALLGPLPDAEAAAVVPPEAEP